ncbi:MAG: family N-acetyltransferase [Armatimonadetes bacterium]|jgi:RimJ/RimL family protein N-acetyltransferase|nr:family N-acetyltransferase [Armatimonadota bacterium]
MTPDSTTVRTLESDDIPAVEAFLRPRLSSSMFLVSNLRRAGIEDRGEPYQGTYAAAWRDKRIVAVAAHYWNGNLIVQAPECLDEVCAAALAGSRRAVRGVIGPGDQVGEVTSWTGFQDAAAQVDEKERLYRLALSDLVLPEALTRGEVTARLGQPHDLDLVTRWLVDYAVSSLGERHGTKLEVERRTMAERSVADQRTWLLEHAGRPVAMTAFNAAIAEAVQVGPVWTPPAERSRGYARAAVAASLRHAREAGVLEAILFTGPANVAAQRAYEALGFRHIGEYRILLLREAVRL